MRVTATVIGSCALLAAGVGAQDMIRKPDEATAVPDALVEESATASHTRSARSRSKSKSSTQQALAVDATANAGNVDTDSALRNQFITQFESVMMPATNRNLNGGESARIFHGVEEFYEALTDIQSNCQHAKMRVASVPNSSDQDAGKGPGWARKEDGTSRSSQYQCSPSRSGGCLREVTIRRCPVDTSNQRTTPDCGLDQTHVKPWPPAQQRVSVICGLHARELTSAHVCLQLARQLCGHEKFFNYEKCAQDGKKPSFCQNNDFAGYNNLEPLENTAFQIIPIANPDGYHRVVGFTVFFTSWLSDEDFISRLRPFTAPHPTRLPQMEELETCRQTHYPSGVDLNHNFPNQWIASTQDGENYGGRWLLHPSLYVYRIRGSVLAV